MRLAQQCVPVKKLSTSILDLLGQGLSPRQVADLLETSREYVRAARSMARHPGRLSIPRGKRGCRQPNLRELAVKLYDMRQEGVL